MRLFDIVPKNFFSLLTLENSNFYIEVLIDLWKEYKELNGGMTKEQGISAMSYFIETKYYEAIKNEEENEFTKLLKDKNVRTLALETLNTFVKYHWIKIKSSHKEYENYILIPSYSRKFIEAIKNVIEPSVDETTGHAINVYFNIRAIGSEDNTSYGNYLNNALSETDKLNNMLQDMFDNMERFFEELLEKQTSFGVMKQLISYADTIIEEKFYPLQTKDNLFKYRQGIISKINALEFNDEVLKITANQLKRLNNLNSIEEAENETIFILEMIKSFFENIDILIRRITDMHSQYMKTTASRINYLINRNEDFEGKLIKVIKTIAQNKEDLKYIDMIKNNIEIEDIRYISNNSMWRIKNKRKRFEPPIVKVKQNTKDEIEKLKRKAINDIKLKPKVLFSEKVVKSYLESLLKEKGTFNTKEICIDKHKTYMLLILTIAYCLKHREKYKVTVTENMIIQNEFKFQEIVVERKGDKNVN